MKLFRVLWDDPDWPKETLVVADSAKEATLEVNLKYGSKVVSVGITEEVNLDHPRVLLTR